MSQRLHIGETDAEIYDCVLTTPADAFAKLRKEWLCVTGSYFLGPWRVRIGDVDLFWQVEPAIEAALRSVDEAWPASVTYIYHEGENLSPSSAQELHEWLRRRTKEPKNP